MSGDAPAPSPGQPAACGAELALPTVATVAVMAYIADMSHRERLCILGGGQMAVVCAAIAADNGHRVRIAARGESARLLAERRFSPHLPGVRLPEDVEVVEEASHVTAGASVVLVALPTQALRGVLGGLDLPDSEALVISCTKGIEQKSLLRPSEVVREAWSGFAGELAVLSGPNIAEEVAARKPAGAVIASASRAAAERGRAAMMTDYFRIYTNQDMVGVEISAAAKNVIAIAAGIVDGLELGNNAKAGLVTRGLVEITRLGLALGAKMETFAGLAGLGDLITTCISPGSRNRTVGERVARGGKLDDVLRDLGSVSEGVPTTRGLLELAGRQGVEMPIAGAVAQILFEGKEVREALLDLMTREPKAESRA